MQMEVNEVLVLHYSDFFLSLCRFYFVQADLAHFAEFIVGPFLHIRFLRDERAGRAYARGG
jgi:hypothetical protein